jgi:hypothetical protein
LIFLITFSHIQLLCSWISSIVLFLFKIQRFEHWTLSPSSDKTYSVGSNRYS